MQNVFDAVNIIRIDKPLVAERTREKSVVRVSADRVVDT